MNNTLRFLACAVLGFALMASLNAGWNEDLAAIDTQIHTATTPTYRQGDAANVLPGVTTALLEQKRLILVSAGFTWFAPATTTGTYDYTNFFSFTGTLGQTDTQLGVVETTRPMLLFRRGYPDEPSRRLGAWWGGSYLSTQATRDTQAVLAAWGSPLTGIYVISVPTGTRMIAGYASPMQRDSEYRAGGAYQYWLNSRDNNWLVYALYAPDYLGSYVLAVSGAQKLSRDAIDGLVAQLREIASTAGRGNRAHGGDADFWLRATASDTDYQPGIGREFNARGKGMMLGWGKTVAGSGSAARLHAGLMVGRSLLRQADDISGLKGDIAANYGGLYAVYGRPSGEAFPWYVSGAILYGRLKFTNNVPGYLGRGLEQKYSGNSASASLEAGMPVGLGCGWSLSPQVQFAATRVSHGDFSDQLGADVSIKQGYARWARLGMQVDKTLLRKNHRTFSFWASSGVIREFASGNAVEVSGEAAAGERIGPVYQFDGGLRYGWNERCTLQGAIGRLAGDERGYRGSVSFTVCW